MAKKTNPHRVRYGTADGDLTFGHITDDNQISSVMIRNFKEPLHYIALSQTGGQFRKNGTICRSTGSFQVRAGDDIGKKSIPSVSAANFSAGPLSMGDIKDLSPTIIDESEYVTADIPGIYLEAVSGDVIIRAPSDVTFSVSPGTNATSVHPGGEKIATFTVSGTLTVS